MNAFVTILTCVCLLGCLTHSSASPLNEIPLIDIECKTVVFVDDAPLRPASSNVEISSVSQSIQEATGAAGNTTIDAGANGCVGGKELKPIGYTGRDANVMGIDRHQLTTRTCPFVHALE